MSERQSEIETERETVDRVSDSETDKKTHSGENLQYTIPTHSRANGTIPTVTNAAVQVARVEALEVTVQGREIL